MTWFIFNIKVMFSLHFKDFLMFFKALQADQWHDK